MTWYCCQDRQREERNRTQSRITPTHTWPTDFWRVQRQFGGENSVFSTNGGGTTGHKLTKKSGPRLTFCIITKINSKGFTGQNKPKTTTYRKRHRRKPVCPWDRQRFLRYDTKSMSPKRSNWSTRLWIKNFSWNKWCWGTCISTFKRMTLGPFFTSFSKINLKQTKDIHEELQW